MLGRHMHGNLVALAGVACAAALLAGCSDDGGGGTLATGSTTAAATTTATTTAATTADATTEPTGEPTTSPTNPTTSPTTDLTTDATSSTTASTATDATTTGPAPVCGDGNVDPGEDCDAGPDNGDDKACTSTCANNVCGDGLVLAGSEECDAGPDNGDDKACTAACANNVCGDGLVLAGSEGCDDGNVADGDGCGADCVLESCGDGKIQGMEACDDGNADDTDACLATCVAASCGDGVVQAGVETCDDGNMSEADACTTLCKAPACDDKIKSGGETDVDCGGMTCPKCAVDKACAAASDCGTGFCSANKCQVAPTCAAIKMQNPQAASGVYTIDPDGNGGKPGFDTVCNMTIDGGGWALVLNLDTSDGHVMWWGNTKWNDGTTKGTVMTALTEDHVNAGWNDYGGAKDLLLVVHTEGTVVGWKSFAKTTTETMRTHLMGNDNTLIGSSVKASDTAMVWAGERLVRLSTTLYANHCVQTNGQCTTGAAGSPDGDRIGSNESTPQDNLGGGLGNWHDMNYCCNGNYGSGKVCNGSAMRTASEAQAGWAACYNAGVGHFGTDTFLPATNTCINNNCAQANWSQASGQSYDYSIYLR